MSFSRIMTSFRYSDYASYVFCALILILTSPVLTRNATTHNNNYDESTHRRYNSARKYSDEIDYRLTKLEVQYREKSDELASELRENSRRLQSLESQNSHIQTTLEAFRNELARISESRQPATYRVPDNYQEITEKLELKFLRGVQLIVATLKGINSDFVWMKRNISSVADTTEALLHQCENLVTKEFLNNSLIEAQNQQMPSPVSSDEPFKVPRRYPANCKDAQQSGNHISGIYLISPDYSPPFMVQCDMDTRGGGWTVIHNRYDGSQDFYLNWHDYEVGFGNIGGEFWLGLERIYQLTGSDLNELLVELMDVNGAKAYAHYAAFSIGSQAESYAIKVLGGYTGDAGDSLTYHAGRPFSTKDFDNDAWTEGQCAQAHTGAWWYKGCDRSNLNGKYLNGELPQEYIYQGMYWGDFRGPQYSLARARMMVRPREKGSPPVFPEGMWSSREILSALEEDQL